LIDYVNKAEKIIKESFGSDNINKAEQLINRMIDENAFSINPELQMKKIDFITKLDPAVKDLFSEDQALLAKVESNIFHKLFRGLYLKEFLTNSFASNARFEVDYNAILINKKKLSQFKKNIIITLNTQSETKEKDITDKIYTLLTDNVTINYEVKEEIERELKTRILRYVKEDKVSEKLTKAIFDIKDSLVKRDEEQLSSSIIESKKIPQLLGISPKTWQTYRDKGVIPFIIGGTQDLTYPLYRAYDKQEQMVNLVSIDSRFDFGKQEDGIKANSYLSKIILDEPNNLFNYTNIGYQTYYNSQEEIDLIEKLFFDAYRLGEISNNIELSKDENIHEDISIRYKKL
jgi:hypothetical protein